MKCLLCEKETFSRYLCFSHYNMCKMQIDKYKNWKIYDLKNYYHNLKHSMYKINRMNIIIPNCLKLMAISHIIALKLNNDTFFTRSIYDIKKLLSFKNNILVNNNQIKSEDKFKDFLSMDFRMRWEAVYVCEDGHRVRSIMELMFDNWLYNHGITHSYEKKVVLQKNPNDIMFCDFYLNMYDIYIELWGKWDSEYVKRRQIKKELYEKNNIRLLELESEDLKRLDDIFYIKIKKIKEFKVDKE